MSDKDETNQGETNETDSAPPKKKVPTWVWVVSGVLVFGLILQSCGGDTPAVEDSEAEIVETEAQVDEENAFVEEDSDSTAEPAPMASQSFATVEELTAAIEQKIGSQTAEGADRSLNVDFQELDETGEFPGWFFITYFRDESMAKADVWTLTEGMFLLARQADFVESLTVIIKTSSTNELGEERDLSAFVVNFDGDTYSRIVTANVVGDQYEQAATGFSFDSRATWGN